MCPEQNTLIRCLRANLRRMGTPSPHPNWQVCMRSLSRAPIDSTPMKSSNPHFDYAPLDAESNDIRFSLLPAESFDEEIIGGLLHVSLGSMPVYETVSYVVYTSSILSCICS